MKRGSAESAVGKGRGADTVGAAVEGSGPSSGPAKSSWDKTNGQGNRRGRAEVKEKGGGLCAVQRRQRVCRDAEGDHTSARGQGLSAAQAWGEAGPESGPSDHTEDSAERPCILDSSFWPQSPGVGDTQSRRVTTVIAIPVRNGGGCPQETSR